MALLKSVFISAYSVMTFVIAAYAVSKLAEDPLPWSAVLLTVVPMAVLLTRLLAFKNISRTRRHLPLIYLGAIIGVSAAIFIYLLRQDAGTAGGSATAVVLSLVALGGFVLYNYWYSSFGRTHGRFKVGHMLPDFELTGLDGKPAGARTFLGKPVIFMFYRGNWCPLCMAQIKDVAKEYAALSSLGAEIILISPQPQSHTERLARKFDVPFVFMTDEDNRAARKLGIANRFGTPFGFQLLGYKSETVLPTVIIIDKGGTIIFADQTDSYRIRPHPANFLRVLEDVAGS